MDTEQLADRLKHLDTPCICDADKALGIGICAVDPAIRPLRRGLKMVGRAHTITCRNDFLTVIKGLRNAQPGEILIIDAQDSQLAVAGELFPTEAMRRGLSGIVVDGACRDSASVRTMAFPYYARWAHCYAGTTNRLFETQVPVNCGGVVVHPGDVVFGDDDGIAIGSASQFEAVLDLAEQIQSTEERILKAMQGGASLFDMLNFDEHCEAIASGIASKLQFKI